MFSDYQSRVVAYYHQKLTLNELSLRLIDPTPASLRDECLAVYGIRNEKKDVEILRIFFDVRENEEFSERKIANCDISIFKPLIRYLKNKTNKTENKNIELLAWLVDFQPRPHIPFKRYEPAGKGVTTVNVKEVNTGDEKAEKKNPGIQRLVYGNPYFKSIIIAVFTFAGLAGAGRWIYGWWDKSDYKNALMVPQKCMYWAGDHYEQVSCDRKFGYDTLVIAYDSITFHNLKKVTRPDTISLKALGKLWYIKRNNAYEFFTSAGYYPLDLKSRLRPVTERIINNQMRLSQELKP